MSLASSSCGGPDPVSRPDPEPGIAQTLAAARARAIRDLRYELAFDIPADIAAPIPARAVVHFTLGDDLDQLVLDFAPGADHLRSVSVNGRDSTYRAINGHIVIPADDLRAGANAVEIGFLAGEASLNRNAEFLYTLFVPARAHLAFPCFDQPDLKARFALALTTPGGWEAVTNGAEVSREITAGRVRTRYAETEPISTYLFAFAAGRFEVESADRAGRRFRMLHRETDTQKVARNRDKVFDLHAAALAWLEDYTGIPYPFGKFDFILVPSFQFSGMEHPGAIYYGANAVLLDESATESQLLGRAGVIAHETAHMWFGDLVTMRWFNDVWMKEVFANFMGGKIVNPAFPAVNHELRFLTAHYPDAYAVDRTAGTHPIRQELGNLADAGSLYGAIIYQKAPIVMRQLERLMGPDRLRDGLREYLKTFAFGNASWLDLVRILDGRTERDLAAWSRAWVLEEGRPAVETHLDTNGDGSLRTLAFVQSDPEPERGLRWTQEIEVLVGTHKQFEVLPLTLQGDRTEAPDPSALPAPGFVLPNGGGLAYGAFVLDEQSRRFLLENLPGLADPVARGSAWVTLWDEMLATRIAPEAFLEALLRALPREEIELNVQLALEYLDETYWRFLSAEQRAAAAARVERVLRDGLRRAQSSSLKATYFRGLRSMATTRAAVGFVERVWQRREKIPGLTLAEPDEAGMALDLAVRAVPDAAAILDAQLARFTNPDRKARFEFVMPAVSGDPAVRDAFFQRLREVQHRRREPWVAEGLSYLHHPLRAEASQQYVQPSLELLEEIHRTGDIFFPRVWIGATLAGHGSPAVAETVRAFLDERPQYPERLRRVVLQAADNLFRAASLR